MISTKNIKKSYKSGSGRTTVLNGISFDVAEGEFVSIMGPSGSGKSTLLHILGMLDTPSSGIYDFLGESVFDLNDRQRANLRDLNRRDGVTVIQVTHNRDYAEIGHRIIELFDGHISYHHTRPRRATLDKSTIPAGNSYKSGRRFVTECRSRLSRYQISFQKPEFRGSSRRLRLILLGDSF